MKSLCSSLVVCSILAASSIASGTATPCKADLDGDGEVSGGDISMLLVKWGGCSGVGCAGDLDSDGEISGGDLSMMLVSWGSCAGPSWATVLEWAPDPTVVYDANLRADIVTTHLPWRVRDNGTGIEMVLIPPGSFLMGCSPSNSFSCYSDESPAHVVTLTRAIYLGRMEVTQAEWTARMGSNPSYFQGASPAVPVDRVSSRPVEQVSWNDIQPFCTNNGLRLPTEAEWEFAYRAGTFTAFHGWSVSPEGTNDDNQVANIAWFSGNSGGETRPVAGRAANGFGLYDMSGNVWEWVSDWIGDYPDATQTDPTGPSGPTRHGAYRVLRGGDFVNFSSDGCRASVRGVTPRNQGSKWFGFRVARFP